MELLRTAYDPQQHFNFFRQGQPVRSTAEMSRKKDSKTPEVSSCSSAHSSAWSPEQFVETTDGEQKHSVHSLKSHPNW
jgi:hypothetical protein